MKNTKMIIGLLVTASALVAGGAYVNNDSEVNEDNVATFFDAKKKHNKKNRNRNYQNNTNNERQYNYGSQKVNNTNPYGEDILLPRINNSQGDILRRRAYTLLYDRNTRLPRWVAWHLTRQHTYGRNSRKNEQFSEDESVAKPRADNFDYMSSGYDRGHMCPAGDNKWDAQALRESFLFTNCCPQLHALNSGPWNDLEIQCREWAKKYGDIYIVCGPILRGTSHKTIGKHKVVVPEAFFKVVLCTSGKPKALGFIYEHNSKYTDMYKTVLSVDEVERITGYDFFQALPDNIENAVESHSDLRIW